MAANELVRFGVVICEYLMKECQHILEKKRNKRKKKDVLLVLHWGTGRDLLVDTGNLW
jgi:predicted nucleic acid-binding Zn ribbon protein